MLNKLIDEFGTIDKSTLKDLCRDQNSLVNIVLRMAKSGPNDIQTCIAAYAILKLNQSPSQMWDLLGGMGKSRVIHTMALMLLLQGYKRVHIVLPTQSLMNREMDEFKDFFRGNESGRVLYHMDFSFEMNDNEIIISDEADYLMFKNPEGFFAKAKSYPMISMTASVPLTDTKSLE